MSQLSGQRDTRARPESRPGRLFRGLQRIATGSQAPPRPPQPVRAERQMHIHAPLPRTSSAPLHGFVDSATKTRYKAINQRNDEAYSNLPIDHVREQDFEHANQRRWSCRTEPADLSGLREKMIDDLKQDNSSLHAKNQDLEQQISRLQKAHFQKIGGPRVSPPEDSFVRLQLSEFQSDITRTGKTYIPPLIDSFQARTEDEMAELCRDLSAVAVDMQEGSTDVIREEVATKKHFGRLLFTSLLSWHIHYQAFSNPFFFLKGKTSGADWSSAFLDVEQLASEDDTDATHKWRSQTLRFFLPKADSEHAIAVRHRTGVSLRAASANACRTFLKSSAAFFLSGMKSDRSKALQRDLEMVFYRAALFSMELWSQEMVLKISCLTDLAGETFKVDSPSMQAHPRHVLDDPADRRLDGQPVQMMMHPWVAVVDSAAGDGGLRILVKATVGLKES